jgi:hypothetical protein
MTENQKIVKWNEDRGLIKTPQDVIIENEMSYVLEEVIESMTAMLSKEARPYARLICKAIRNGNVKTVGALIEENELQHAQDGGDEIIEPTRKQIADACCDIKVFATGTIRKVAFDPDIAMHEVQTEIDSRAGSILDGKFVKDMSLEAQAAWYKADFDRADLIKD